MDNRWDYSLDHRESWIWDGYEQTTPFNHLRSSKEDYTRKKRKIHNPFPRSDLKNLRNSMYILCISGLIVRLKLLQYINYTNLLIRKVNSP